jgi:hypothetical protein
MQLSNIDLYKLHTDEFGKWIHALFGASKGFLRVGIDVILDWFF